MKETERRRWRVLNEDTIEILNKEYNEFVVFVARHLKSTCIFVVLLVTAVLTHLLSAYLLSASHATVPTAYFLNIVGFVCLVMDGLWLTRIVIPWRAAADWYSRRYAAARMATPEADNAHRGESQDEQQRS